MAIIGHNWGIFACTLLLSKGIIKEVVVVWFSFFFPFSVHSLRLVINSLRQKRKEE
jgi:hypothetical protein